MAWAGYCTLEEFKASIDLDDNIDDALIDNKIRAASIAVDNFCDTRFWQSAAATPQVFDTGETWRVRIPAITTVTEVATDDNADGTFETVWAGTDYQLLPLNPTASADPEPYTEIHAIGSLTFPRVTTTTMRHGLIRVTGTWGWPGIPQAVTEATILITNRLLARRHSPQGVEGFVDIGVVRVSAREDPHAVLLLTPYRTSHRKGGWAFA